MEYFRTEDVCVSVDLRIHTDTTTSTIILFCFVQQVLPIPHSQLCSHRNQRSNCYRLKHQLWWRRSVACHFEGPSSIGPFNAGEQYLIFVVGDECPDVIVILTAEVWSHTLSFVARHISWLVDQFDRCKVTILLYCECAIFVVTCFETNISLLELPTVILSSTLTFHLRWPIFFHR